MTGPRTGGAGHEITAIPEQPQEVSGVLAPGHHQNLLDSSIDQSLYRIIKHRLVINRKQMLIRDPHERIQSAPRSPARTTPFMFSSSRSYPESEQNPLWSERQELKTPNSELC